VRAGGRVEGGVEPVDEVGGLAHIGAAGVEVGDDPHAVVEPALLTDPRERLRREEAARVEHLEVGADELAEIQLRVRAVGGLGDLLVDRAELVAHLLEHLLGALEATGAQQQVAPEQLALGDERRVGREIARISSARSARIASPSLMYAQACSKSARSK
jgi:hypothetical protein